MNTDVLINPPLLRIPFQYGKGVWLYDKDDKAYLDALAGIAVCGLGHAHPRLVKAIQEQAAKLLHTSNIYLGETQVKLANKLMAITGLSQAFFGNSGAEANEAAIKMVRLYGHARNIDKPMMVVAEKAFHGRTMATLSASGSRHVQAGFEPLVAGFVRAPYNDIAALRTIAENTPDVVAIMLEPIQGEGGLNIPAADYLTQVRALCDEFNWLMILDEVQTGNGRTGAFYAYQHQHIMPDILCTAKGLGGGLPISAFLIAEKLTGIFKPTQHGTTYGGNPLVCAGANVVLDVIQEENLLENATKMGAFIQDSLRSELAGIDAVRDIRGQGLMIGIELDRPCRDMMKLGATNGLLFSVTAEKVIRLLPPLIINQEECEQLVERLVKTIKAFVA
jgi:acetylornithine/N-succinyldiaminopimelate aminotransferase